MRGLTSAAVKTLFSIDFSAEIVSTLFLHHISFSNASTSFPYASQSVLISHCINTFSDIFGCNITISLPCTGSASLPTQDLAFLTLAGYINLLHLLHSYKSLSEVDFLIATSLVLDTCSVAFTFLSLKVLPLHLMFLWVYLPMQPHDETTNTILVVTGFHPFSRRQ